MEEHDKVAKALISLDLYRGPDAEVAAVDFSHIYQDTGQ